MNERIVAGLIQHTCSAVPPANLQKALDLITDAAHRGAELVVLPELFSTRYFCQSEVTAHFDLAEPIPGPTCERLAEAAREHGIVLIASLFERRAAGVYHNTAVVFERDGRIAGRYRKMHIPDDPGYHEKFYFTPGDLGFHPIETSVGKLGVLVCWDQWFPEAARLMALRGAELLIYPTAVGWNPPEHPGEKARQRDAWLISQRAHAVANGLPVLCVNRTGHEPDPSGVMVGIDFWGSSFAAGPQGEMLHTSSADVEEVAVVEIDKGRGEEVRRIWPFLRDRRIDAYSGLDQRYLE